jgi:type VI secretion system protein ImpM
MPREVLTPELETGDDRPLAGFFGKVPFTGDFVSRGLPDAFRRHWDSWLTHHIAPLQRGGQVFPPGGLRFRLPSGGRVAAGVILPSEDSAGRRFPLSVLLIAKGNLALPQINAWCDAALHLLPGTPDADTLWLALEDLPAPEADGPATGPMKLWTAGHTALDANPQDPAATLARLLPDESEPPRTGSAGRPSSG